MFIVVNSDFTRSELLFSVMSNLGQLTFSIWNIVISISKEYLIIQQNYD